MFSTINILKSETSIKLNIPQAAQALSVREPLNYKDLYGNTTDLCKMVENNSDLSIRSTYTVSPCILCHLPAFQADLERFR